MVGKNDDALGFGRQLHLFQSRGGERRPHGKAGAGLHHGEAGFDPFTDAKRRLTAESAKPHGAARDLPQHHARLGHGGLGDGPVGVLTHICAVQADDFACAVAHHAQHSRIARARIPVGQVRVEKQISGIRSSKPPPREIALDRRTGNRQHC